MKQPILLLLFLAAALSASAQKLYWLDSFTQRSWRTSDGFGDIQQITPNVQGKLWGFALDPEGEKIYYATDVSLGSGSPAIIRTNLNDAGLETIVPAADAGQPRQLALDLQNQHIYWTSGKYPDVSIRRAGLDGSNPAVVIDLNGSNAPKGITLDPAGNRMFWTHEYKNNIYYANLDGSGAGSFEAANTVDESCLDLAIHPSEGKVYWVTRGSFGEPSKVYKASFDGSDREVIADLDQKTPIGIEVDTANNKVYWSLWLDDLVQRCNTDGSEMESYFAPEDYLNSSIVGEVSDLAFDYAMVSGLRDLFSNQPAGFDLYPNPATGPDLTLKFSPGIPTGSELTISIYDAQGRLAQQETLATGTTLTFRHRLQPGIYRVAVQAETGLTGSNWLLVNSRQ